MSLQAVHLSTIGECVDRFLNACAVMHTPSTCSAYTIDLRFFLEYVGSDSALEAIAPAEIEGFIAHTSGKNYAWNTVARRVAAIKSFFRWALLGGMVAMDPARAIAAPMRRATNRKIFSQSDIRDIIKGAPMGSREAAILEVLAVGVKATEATFLDCRHFNLERGTLRIGARTVILPESAYQALDVYIQQGRMAYSRNNCEALFLNYAGGRLSRQQIWKAMRSASNATASPADFRRSAVVNLLDSGLTPEAILEQTGHCDTSTLLAIKAGARKD